MQQINNYIGGRLVEPVSGEYLENFDPATGQVYSLTPDSDERDVQAAVNAAKKAFHVWSNAPTEYRHDMMMQVSRLIEKNLDELAAAETIDNGKPLSLAKCCRHSAGGFQL